MSRKVLGIDIRKESISAVLVRTSLRENRIDAHAHIPLPEAAENLLPRGRSSAVFDGVVQDRGNRFVLVGAVLQGDAGHSEQVGSVGRSGHLAALIGVQAQRPGDCFAEARGELHAPMISIPPIGRLPRIGGGLVRVVPFEKRLQLLDPIEPLPPIAEHAQEQVPRPADQVDVRFGHTLGIGLAALRRQADDVPAVGQGGNQNAVAAGRFVGHQRPWRGRQAEGLDGGRFFIVHGGTSLDSERIGDVAVLEEVVNWERHNRHPCV